MRRVVALPSTCGSLTQVPIPTGDPDRHHWETRPNCSEHTMAAIDTAIRSSLEFRGFHVIDAEEVNAVTATRREVRERRASSRPRRP
jgi:hypothetical protein